ncbi:speedy protein 1-B-like [Discoglossus pictus]
MVTTSATKSLKPLRNHYATLSPEFAGDKQVTLGGSQTSRKLWDGARQAGKGAAVNFSKEDGASKKIQDPLQPGTQNVIINTSCTQMKGLHFINFLGPWFVPFAHYYMLDRRGLIHLLKYLLAMDFSYFKRAWLHVSEYTRMNFFIALFLANDMEEDVPFKRQIYLWALGATWRQERRKFHRQRHSLWRRMEFQAFVSRDTCEQIMAEDPSHWVWRRDRKEYHGWAIRRHLRRKEEFLLQGPGDIPPFCSLCFIFEVGSANH